MEKLLYLLTVKFPFILHMQSEALDRQPYKNGKKENGIVQIQDEDKNEREESKNSQVSCKLVNVEQETALWFSLNPLHNMFKAIFIVL